MNNLVNNKKLLIYDYDCFKMTALHWASKRNNIEVVKILIDNNSYLESKDIWGRNPLYYAIVNNHPDVVFLLLYNNASPWSITGYNFDDLVDDKNIAYYLKKFRKFDISKKFMKKKNRENFIKFYQKEFLKIPKNIIINKLIN